jgi:hypothetical protein
MPKRPRIKGRGADIYLGGDSEERLALPQKAPESVEVVEQVDSEKVFASSTSPEESVCALDGLKRAAACYIDDSEKLSYQAIDLQEKSMASLMETMLAWLFEMHSSFARMFVQCSACAMRNLWQIRTPEQQPWARCLTCLASFNAPSIWSLSTRCPRMP